MHRFLLAVLVACGLVSACDPTSNEQTIKSGVANERVVRIATGFTTGIYLPAGSAICRVANESQRPRGIRCSVESTAGSIYNIDSIRLGQFEFGVAQSDWQYHAYNGTSSFTGKGAFKNLRAVFSLHPEPLSVVVRADSNMKSFADIKGSRLNIGHPGSHPHSLMLRVFKAKGWRMKDFKFVSLLRLAEQSRALCDRKVDAIVFTSGHPSGSVQAATNSCSTKLLSVTGPAIDKLIESTAYYRRANIPGGVYRGVPNDVPTFGVGATFVSSAAVPDDVVYELVKAVFDRFDQFKKLHPALKHLKEKEMIKDSLSAPLHDGAIRYYRERGWM